MKALTHIGIFLDLSETDEFLLRYFKKLDDVFDFSSLTLVHFVALDHHSTEAEMLQKQIHQPLEDLLEKEIQDLVVQVFGEKKSSIHIKIDTGGKLDHLVRWVDQQHFNLIVLGKKEEENGGGAFSSKVIRITDSESLLVPEGSPAEFDKMILALDFSSYTDRVVQRGINLSSRLSSELKPIYAMQAGFQYFPYFRDEEAFQKELKKKILAKYLKLQKKTGLKSELEMLPDAGNAIAKTIIEYTSQEDANLLIVGNKGNSDEDDLLVGTVTDQLINSDLSIPILIVKKGY